MASIDPASNPEVSVIVPARNEEPCLRACLSSLLGQKGMNYEVIVVDDDSTDGTRPIAESFGVRVISGDPLPNGWSGKCNAAWSGARVAKGKWLLFTDADTKHAPQSIVTGVREATDCGAALLSYSPRQEVHSLAECALMPVIFAELAATYRPQDVCDPGSPAAAANGQYLLVRRDAYDAVGGHAAVAAAILEDVELAKRTKRAGYRLRFRWSDAVSTRMYRSFPQMWEGWTKNLALLFASPRRLALLRAIEFGAIAGSFLMAFWDLAIGQTAIAILLLVVGGVFWSFLLRRISRAHFDGLSNSLSILGLPFFAILLLNSSISHSRGSVSWKGRKYGSGVERLGKSELQQSVGLVVPNQGSGNGGSGTAALQRRVRQ